MESVDLSVIVACYNVDQFVKQCLDSIQATNFPPEHLEVIMVDDGSNDQTGPIIDHYAQEFANFNAYHKENGGISTTRNFGMDHAHGRYIAFVDGDDVVPQDAYTNLMYTAEINQADVVAGFVHRFDSLRHDVPSYLHSFAIKDDRTHLTLKQDPQLLYDTTVWNKVYRRAFLVDHGIRFMEGIIYEDLPFTLEVHLASQNTATIKNVVYQWRWRETNDSITQSRSAINNYQNRLNALNQCSQLLINSGYDVNSEVYKTLEKKVLTLDLAIFLDEIGNAEEDYIYQVQELTYLFLRDWNLWDSELIRSVPLKQQIEYYAIKTGNFQLLKKYTYVKNVGLFKRGTLLHRPKFFFPSLKHSELLKHLSFAPNMFPDFQILNRLNVNLDQHIIHGNGVFRIKRLWLNKKWHQNNNYYETLSARLINIENNRELPINFTRKVTPLYKRILKPKGLWTNARYEFKFNYLTALKKLGRGVWMIKMRDDVDHKFIAERYMANFQRKLNTKLNELHDDQNQITTAFNTNGELTFKVSPLALVGDQKANWVAQPNFTDQQLIFKANLIDQQNVMPILKAPHFTIKGQVLATNPQQIKFDLATVSERTLMDQPLQITLVHVPTNKSVEYSYDKTQVTQMLTVDDSRKLRLTYQNSGGIKGQLIFNPFKITKFKLKANVLLFQGKIDINLDQFHLNLADFKIEMLNHNKVRRKILTPEQNQIDFDGNNFSFRVPLTDSKKQQLLLLAGSYTLTVYLPINGLVRAIPLVMNKQHSIAKRTLPFNDRDEITYRVFSDAQNLLHIAIQQPFYGWNRKRSHRALAYSLLYPLMRHLPLQKTVVFDSYWASQFSSNERAIYEYLQQHDPQIKTVWFFNNRQMPISGHGERVRVGTLKYWYYLAVAKYLFQNTNFPNEYLKRKGQIEVETLHGTFLKHMGFNEPHFRNAKRAIQHNFADRIRRWDYLVVPSNYMAQTASQAFDYHQKIIRAGFPRNDELYTHNNPQYINQVKQRLGIAANKRVLLYAPTYRDDGGFDFKLDLAMLQKQLADQYVILVRLHYFVAHSNHFYDYPGFVYDVSDYQDINDLYLISDALITDYSSVMFDYAHLKRPMIFFAYDRDWYLDDQNRGIYLDYDRQMPGPIVTNNHELLHVIKQLPQERLKYAPKLQQFHDQFAEYGNQGDAAAQVVKTVFNTNNADLDQDIDTGVLFNKFWHIFKIKRFQPKLMKFLGNHLPKRKIVIFDSFFGTQYSDNPKAIYQYMVKHHPEYDLYWNVNVDDLPYFKQHHLPYVKRFGYRGLLKQAQAKYYVTNVRRPFRWKVTKGTKLLQTWHGTPLKRIGTDVSLVTMPGNNAVKYHHQVYRDAKRWNYLVAPNEYSNLIMQRAFQMDANSMMLTGYPRNDILINADQDYINNVRSKLGLDSDRKVILYAPTWRDDEYVKSDEFTAKLHLDLQLLEQRFGNKIVVLIRTHYLIANQLDLSNSKIALNVSDYPDVADLYLVSDVLITDYSSAMFDYAVLKRPMIFFAYDLEQYAHGIRGFYFDFAKEVPGPIVQTNQQVVEQLTHVLTDWHVDDKYQRFVNKYNQWTDGKSSQRVVEQMLNDDNVYMDTDVNWHDWHLDDQVKINDGAILWREDKNFTNSDSLGFIRNYNEKEEWFDVVKGMQLRSTSFHEPLGIKYILIRKNNFKAWINLADVN